MKARTKTLMIAAAALALTCAPATASDHEDADGILNPDELSIAYFARKLERGEKEPMAANLGYAAAKSGDYAMARRILERQAAAGNTQAMTWMAWLEDNGLGAPESPEKAAEWDRKAAELGDWVAQFNYGLDLLRGRGVPRDPIRGRAMIDRAAAAGDDTAQRLQAAGYDLDEVTPDADAWKYDRRVS